MAWVRCCVPGGGCGGVLSSKTCGQTCSGKGGPGCPSLCEPQWRCSTRLLCGRNDGGDDHAAREPGPGAPRSDCPDFFDAVQANEETCVANCSGTRRELLAGGKRAPRREPRASDGAVDPSE